MTYDELIQMAREATEDTLRYVGESGFDVSVSAIKVLITLRSGENHWFFYSTSAQRRDIAGEVITWLMDRENSV